MSVWVVRNRDAERELMARVRAKLQARGRAPGLHLTDLIYCLRKSWHRLRHPEWYDAQPPDDAFTLITALGHAYHWLLERAAEEPRELAGIHYSPDEIEIERTDAWGKRVVEFKTTRTSATKTLGEMPNYVEQLASYCLFEGAQYGRLQILHLVGTYSPPTPKHIAWDLAFDPLELRMWAGELARRKQLLEAAQRLEDIPLAEHYRGSKGKTDWECDYCPIGPKGAGLCPGGGGERMPFFAIDTVED